MSLGVASPVQAQDVGQIEGTVTTTEGEPLPGATVQIVDLERGTSADPNGNFELRGVPAGSHVLTVRFIGYQPAEQAVTVRSGEATTVSVALASREVALEGLTVTSQKRVQRIQEVPVAITAYNQRRLS
jgi:hypothetical protein